MKHVHVRPQQNGWMVLSVEVCCSRIGEGFGSVGFQFGAGVRPSNPVGRWGGWKLRPPKPALASPAHRGAERNGSSTLHSSLEPTRARRWDGGGNPGPRLKSGEQALPERVGGWRFAAGRRRVGRAQRRQGRMVAARTAMGKGVLQVWPLVLVVSILCKNELSRGLKGCCLLPLTRKSKKVPGFLFRVENDAGCTFHL